MIVRKWMTKKPITASKNSTIIEIYNLITQNRIRRVPIVEEEKLIGIVSMRDVYSALPFDIKKLSRDELITIKSNLTAGDIMTQEVITIGPDHTIEKAALLMHEHKIGGLPIVENDKLVGIITEHDMFEALLEVTGSKWGVPRLTLVIDDRPGSVKEVTDVIRKYPAKILSFMITKYQMPPDKRELILRVDSERLSEIIAELKEKFGSVVVHRET